MARPITCTGVRRLAVGSPVEGRTKMGLWFPWDDLSPASQTRVIDYGRAHGLFPFPTDQFEHLTALDQLPPPDPSTATGDPSTSSTDDDDFGLDDLTIDPDIGRVNAAFDAVLGGDGDSTSSTDGGGMMEDIVRRIASELDAKMAHGLTDAITSYVDVRMASFDNQMAMASTGVIRTVTLVRPNLTVDHEDLFHTSVPELLEVIGQGIHSYLPGPPGTGKTHSARQVANMLGYKFGLLTCGPQTGESAFYGGMDAGGRFHETPLIECARHAMSNPSGGAIFLCDEMDNGNASVFTTLNTVLANGMFQTRQGEMLEVGRNLIVIATANTFGTGPTAQFAGRNRLDAAQLDRFAYLPWPTDLALEEALVRKVLEHDEATRWLDKWQVLRGNVEERDLKFFVTMRGAITGARLMAAGMPMGRAMMLVAGNKLPADQWETVRPLGVKV